MVAPITSWLWWVGDGPHGPGLSPRWHGRGTSAPPWALLVRRHANVLARVVGHARRITHLPARKGEAAKNLVERNDLECCRGSMRADHGPRLVGNARAYS